jgi:glycosyltransferase involved in cell wall biosynthesis
MRIALISNTLPPEGRGGAEAYVAALADALAGRHEILVLSGARGIEVDGVAHVRLPAQPPVGEHDSTARRALWHARDQWRPAVHRATLQALRAFAPDVVHTHEPQGLSAAVFTATASAKRPHVHTAHDLNLLCARTSMTRAGRFCGGHCRDCGIQRAIRGTAVRRHLTRLLAVSHFIRDRHVEAGVVSPERALTIHLAAAPGVARLRRAGEGRLRLGFIGSLVETKGVLTLLEAVRGAPEGWTVDVAGAGPLEERVRDAAAGDERIRHLGQIGGAAKEAFFDGLDVLVIPSEWEEPGATVCFEAAVRGIPSVVSDRGGLPELPEVTVFRSGDPEALRRALASFADEPRRLEARSARLLAAHDEFLWETHVGKVEHVLEQAANEPLRR